MFFHMNISCNIFPKLTLLKFKSEVPNKNIMLKKKYNYSMLYVFQ